MEYWTITRQTASGRTRSTPFRVNKLGKLTIYFASPHGDRVVQITVSKPKKGRRVNKPTIAVIDEIGSARQ